MVSECKCTMAKSVLGDGCPHCQPQTYIKNLEGWLSEERQEAEALRQHADAMWSVLEAMFCAWNGDPDLYEEAEAALSAYRAESAAKDFDKNWREQTLSRATDQSAPTADESGKPSWKDAPEWAQWLAASGMHTNQQEEE